MVASVPNSAHATVKLVSGSLASERVAFFLAKAAIQDLKSIRSYLAPANALTQAGDNAAGKVTHGAT